MGVGKRDEHGRFQCKPRRILQRGPNKKIKEGNLRRRRSGESSMKQKQTTAKEKEKVIIKNKWANMALS